MRAAPWLVGLACVLAVVVPTAFFAGAEDPGPREAAVASEAGDLREFSGWSALHVRGACLDATTCVGETTRENGAFFLRAIGHSGRVVVSWDAVNESLKVLRVKVAGIELEGESPIEFSFPSLEPGAHAVRATPARLVAGAYDQRIDWVATFTLGTPASAIDTRGHSGFVAQACVLATCAPLTRYQDAPLLVPWTAHGVLTVDWDPVEGPMRVSIPGTGFVVEGEPPLSIVLDGLTEGEWTVRAEPVGALARGEVEVAWRAQLVEAP